MKDRVVLLTKDALCKSYLPIYGNNNNSMPNLEQLAEKGTVFSRFYAAAPSTAMSFIGMFLKKHPYQTEHKKYVAVTNLEKDTAFDHLHEYGYRCEIIWDKKWIPMAQKYSQCYGEHTNFNLIDINQTVGAHNLNKGDISIDNDLAKATIKTIEETVSEVVSKDDGKLFLWIHLPHVLQGRNCYGGDMDMFDMVIGIIRKYFSDDAIYISADHGNMNGTKNKICYGFDVYESAINIPLITPRIDGMNKCDIPLSNTRIIDIMDETIPQEKFIYSDCAYYAQPHRRLAIIQGKFKYIYNKKNKLEELYDIEFDPQENCNIAQRTVLDTDRRVMTPLDQVYYYPCWDEAHEALLTLRAEKDRIWREETFFQKIKEQLLAKARVVYTKIHQKGKR